MAINTFDPKYHSTSFVNLHAARTATGEGEGVTTQPFESLLGGYTKVAEKSQVEKEIAKAPGQQQPQPGLWDPRFKV